MTVGAAGGMNVFFKTILNPGDEVVTFTPYFGEYRSYTANYDGKLIEVPCDPVTFEPDVKALEAALTPLTKIVIVNSPNNPTGAVYSKECLEALAAVLEKKEKEFGTSIYLFSDEPYREIVFGDTEVPWIPSIYQNTVVGYSYSKSLSLPGERIGFLVMPSEIDDFADVTAAANTANRILGFVNAPSLMQRVAAKCVNAKTDVAYYAKNRQMLTEGLKAAGYTFVEPQGAFYLWLKSPEPDEKAFVAKAKERQILIVPGSSFGCAGWVRIAYCVSDETVKNALPGFMEIAKEYGLGE
jgi:aspartate aminotransferase